MVWHGNEDLRPLLVPIASLKLDADNARRHPIDNQEKLSASLKTFTQQKPIVTDARGVVYAGNGTIEELRKLGWTHIARTVSNLPPAKLRAFALADNITSDSAGWDPEVFHRQLEDLEGVGFDLDAAGLAMSEEEIADLIGEVDGQINGTGQSAGSATQPQNFQPVAATTQPRLDQRKPIACPHCGKEFVPGKKDEEK